MRTSLARYLLFLLVIATILTALPQLVFAQSEFGGGSGTKEDPYVIKTKDHLNSVRNHLDKHFVLENDIEFSESDFQSTGAFYNNDQGWQPIGDEVNCFTGFFDGNGFAIKNLYVNANHQDEHYLYTGLFGYALYASIINLGIENLNMSVRSNTNAFGGGISGSAELSVIDNCYSSGKIKIFATTPTMYVAGIVGDSYESFINSCRNSCEIEVYNNITKSFTGGITANTFGGTISNCINTGKISNKLPNESSQKTTLLLAGIACNTLYSDIHHCYNLGEIYGSHITNSVCNVGGITCTSFDTTITYCYNTANISSESITSSSFSLSRASGIACITDESSVEKCFNTGNILALDYAGGIISNGDHSKVSQCYSSGNITSLYAGGICAVISNNSSIINCFSSGHVTEKPKNEGEKYCSGGYIAAAAYSSTVIQYCYNGEKDRIGYQIYAVGDDSATTKYCVDTPNNEQLYPLESQSFYPFNFQEFWTMEGSSYYLYPELKNLTMENPEELQYIEVTKKPLKTNYKEGEAFEQNGMEVTAYYKNNTSKIITNYTVLGYSANSGFEEVTVSYCGKTSSFKVTVERAPTQSTSPSASVSQTAAASTAAQTSPFPSSSVLKTSPSTSTITKENGVDTTMVIISAMIFVIGLGAGFFLKKLSEIRSRKGGM